MSDLQQRLRRAADTLRRTSMPLADLIPLLQQAADALEAQPAQAVRSKLGAGVPMTDEQAGRIAIDDGWNASDPEYRAFIDGIRAAERRHGIVGKEGGA